MGYLDVGGGLAIDYDGSKTDFHASKNYELEEYAADVVGHIQAACTKADVPAPTHRQRERPRHRRAPFGAGVRGRRRATRCASASRPSRKPDAHRLLRELYETYKGIQPKNVQE